MQSLMLPKWKCGHIQSQDRIRTFSHCLKQESDRKRDPSLQCYFVSCFFWQSVASLLKLLLKLRCILWDFNLVFTLTKHTHHSRCSELKLKFKFCFFCLFLLTNRWHIRILLYSEVSRQRIWRIELLSETFLLKYFQCSGLRSSLEVVFVWFV